MSLLRRSLRCAIPLTVQVDAGHGGRWTSLRGGGREWLWHRDEPQRAHVIPGDAFADAGGLEECVPTVRGIPDHGDAWSRAWTVADDAASLRPCRPLPRTSNSPGASTSGRAQSSRSTVLTAEPGFRFVWAGHALLDLSEHAFLQAGQEPKARLFPEAAPYLGRPWPDARRLDRRGLAGAAGLRLDDLGPDDGSAVGAVMHGAEPLPRPSSMTVPIACA